MPVYTKLLSLTFLSAFFAIGCGQSDGVIAPGETTAEQEAAAQAEVQQIEEIEKAQHASEGR